ncbi:MAG: hypothetical protein P8R42_15795 [Candidatus Binatia bacterium]|nr:hypothetical protein [Candidatus Binatia bacterium]
MNAIYGVNLTTYAYDSGHIEELKGIAQSIMDTHEAAYGEPPAMAPWGAAFLATALLDVGAWSILFRARVESLHLRRHTGSRAASARSAQE